MDGVHAWSDETTFLFFSFFILFMYWPSHMACGILVLRPGIEPAPFLRWKLQVLTTGPPGKSPHFLFYPLFSKSLQSRPIQSDGQSASLQPFSSLCFSVQISLALTAPSCQLPLKKIQKRITPHPRAAPRTKCDPAGQVLRWVPRPVSECKEGCGAGDIGDPETPRLPPVLLASFGHQL